MGAVRLRRPTRCVAPSRGVGLFGAGETACAEAERLTIFRDFKVTQSPAQGLHPRLASELLNFSKLQFPHLENEGHSPASPDRPRGSVRHVRLAQGRRLLAVCPSHKGRTIQTV